MAGKSPIGMLFEDDSLSNLSEDFKAKATVIFETAVANQVIEEKKVIEEEFSTKLDEEKTKIAEEMEDKIDSYLTHVAEEWLTENQLAVDNGISNEIAENFMTGMKELFEESYVTIPEDKVDVVTEMTVSLDKKSKELDESIEANITLKKEIQGIKKNTVIAECTKGLADTEVERVTELSEMVDFEDEAQFTSRVSTIVETYFKPLTEEEKKEKEEAEKKDDADKGDDTKDSKDKDEKKDDVKESMQDDSFVKMISESISGDKN